MNNKYSREIKPGVFVDVYDTLQAFNVTCPATAHAIKKLLAPGQRGAKSQLQDLQEAKQSIDRAIVLVQMAELKESGTLLDENGNRSIFDDVDE